MVNEYLNSIWKDLQIIVLKCFANCFNYFFFLEKGKFSFFLQTDIKIFQIYSECINLIKNFDCMCK